MSSFFSLGGLAFGVTKDEQIQDQEDDGVITPNSLHLFRNEEIRNKEFEIWQQYYQLHQQHNNTAACNSNSNSNSNNNNSNIPTAVPCWKMMRQGGYGIAGGEYVGSGSGSGSGGSSGINCQDCGNQAKKDCPHMRCRTCCRSRGFPCQTHVKSTWVPAAKRRERHQQQLGLVMRSGGNNGGDDQNTKRLREDHHFITTGGGGGGVVVNVASTHHQNISSGLETGHFPAEVSSPAVFRCVRVSAMNVAEEQLAYQTTVSIGGHVFKGILYDHGPSGGDSSSTAGDGGSSSQHQQLNLITSGTMGAATTTVNPNATSVDPSSMLPTPLNAFMVGTQFFPPPRS